RVVPEYMALICQRPGFWEAMRDRVTGTVQRRKRLNPPELLGIEVDLPPLTEQRRIVDLITHIDSALRHLVEYKQRVDALLDAASNWHVWERDWPPSPVEDLAAQRGLVGGPFGSSLGTKDYVDAGVPVIRGANLSGPSRFVSGEFVFVSDDKAASLARNDAR